MKKADTRELKNGFGDAFAAAFELTVTPAIFGGNDVEADGKDVNGAVLLT